MGWMIVLSLAVGSTLESLITPAGCHFFWLTIIITTTVLTSGGFAMALFRVIVIKMEADIEEAKAIMMKIIGLEVIMVAGQVAGTGYGNYYSGAGLAQTFCSGHSSEMNKLITEYQGSTAEDITFGLLFTLIAVGTGQIAIITELLVYCYLYIFQLRHNQRMASEGLFSQEIVVQRHQKNVITMSGQASAFCIECIASIIIQIMMSQKVELLESASFPLVLVVLEALVTISHIWSSPELRRFYWDGL